MNHIQLDLDHKYVIGSQDYSSDIMMIPFHKVTYVSVEKRYGTGAYVKIYVDSGIYVMQFIDIFEQAIEFAKNIMSYITGYSSITEMQT